MNKTHQFQKNHSEKIAKKLNLTVFTENFVQMMVNFGKIES